jgi:histidine triad (HIT) family protein
MTDCLFCKIVAKEIESKIVLETDDVLAFEDINPAAPTHVLVIPKKHVASSHELRAADGDLLGKLFEAIASVAEKSGTADGYRVVTNVGPTAGQSVFHLHMHVIGGRQLSWPPG